MKLQNHYFLVRHGQALSNITGIISCWPEKVDMPLTEEGVQQVKQGVKKLKKNRIDAIISSDILRTKQSAEILGEELKIKPQYDKRLREYDVGVLNGTPINELRSYFKDIQERFTKKPRGGETYEAIRKRVKAFIKDQEKKYQKKNIVVVSHQVPISMLLANQESLSQKQLIEKYFKENRIKNAEIRQLP